MCLRKAKADMHNWQKILDNPQLKTQFLMREQVIDALRSFFKRRNFHEVETPLLVKSPGTEPYLEVFETTLKFAEGDNHRGFLLTSPEYAMKKLLSAGFGDIFQICKSFRNKEGRSDKHNPEFTILEYYRVNADYTALMDDQKEMLLHILRAVTNDPSATILKYQDLNIDLNTWQKYSVAEAFEKFAGVSTDDLLDEEKLVNIAKEKGYQVDEHTTWEQAFNQIFLNEIESQFNPEIPTIIYDYPVSQAALSRKKVSDPRFAERFEYYIAGVEIGNAFSELNDPVEQQQRLEAELAHRKTLDKTQFELDQDFIKALEHMPDSAGIAIGVDRLIMLFANVPSIKDTILFPVEEMFGN